MVAATFIRLLALFWGATCSFSQVNPPEPHSTSNIIRNGTIVVDANGTRLSYTDSGPPSQDAYTTIFAIHGMAFNSGIFSKVQSLSGSFGFRIVAINRRGYAGSTPYTNEQLSVISNGTDTQRDDFYKVTGLELLRFMDIFIQDNAIPPISADGKSGGAALVGWSIGNMASLAAIAHIDLLSQEVRDRFASRIRTLIMQEPSSNALGLPAPAQNWVPLQIVDPTIPANSQYEAFAQWVTAYFEHGNLLSHDPNVISWVVPAVFRPFSIFNMSLSQYHTIVDTSDNPAIDVMQLNLATQLKSCYRGANFNTTIRSLLPNMKNWFITGDKSASFGPYAIWVVEDDNAAVGGGFINFRYVHGVNHFMHWDNPETTLQVYKELIHG